MQGQLGVSVQVTWSLCSLTEGCEELRWSTAHAAAQTCNQARRPSPCICVMHHYPASRWSQLLPSNHCLGARAARAKCGCRSTTRNRPPSALTQRGRGAQYTTLRVALASRPHQSRTSRRRFQWFSWCWSGSRCRPLWARTRRVTRLGRLPTSTHRRLKLGSDRKGPPAQQKDRRAL